MKIKKMLTYVLSFLLILQLCACTKEIIICPSCSEKQDAGASFCNECGAPLSSEKESSEESEPNDKETKKPNEADSTEYHDEETETPGGGSSGCSICAYEGLDECQGHECISCEGSGSIKCYGCTNGKTAYGACDFCDGKGKFDCICDGGTVYYDKDVYIPETNETTPCTKCEDGYVECSLCKGTGKFGTYSIGGFDGADSVEVEKTCSKCGGRKKKECTTCGGDGMI